MWKIYEHKTAIKQLDSLPADILKRYEKWKDIIAISGPTGLKQIKGFNDESLKGEWKGYRSSRLNLQYRVIYKETFARKDAQIKKAEICLIFVENLANS